MSFLRAGEEGALAALGLSAEFQGEIQEVDHTVALASSGQVSQPTEQVAIVEEGREEALHRGSWHGTITAR